MVLPYFSGSFMRRGWVKIWPFPSAKGAHASICTSCSFMKLDSCHFWYHTLVSTWFTAGLISWEAMRSPQSFIPEAGDADGPDASFPVQSLHGPPGAVIVAVRFMDEVKVQVIHAQFLAGKFEGLQCIVIAVVLYPQLRGQENIFLFNPAFFDRTAYTFFIAVGSSRINEPVSQGESIADGSLRFLRRCLVHTKAQDRYFHAIVYCYMAKGRGMEAYFSSSSSMSV